MNNMVSSGVRNNFDLQICVRSKYNYAYHLKLVFEKIDLFNVFIATF